MKKSNIKKKEIRSIYEAIVDASNFEPSTLTPPYSWVGHLHFAAFLIDQIKPKIFVELGTHTGNSYFAFCQSVSVNKLDTKCYAVDTWQGDEHSGKYNDDIYQCVNEINIKNYDGFSTLLKMTFDEALDRFQNGSVELLHIDGLHTYEAVKHDFETWLPKLAPGAIVLFHDTNVKEADFGVWQLWEELQKKYPNNIEFFHSHGLGILQIENPLHPQKNEWLIEDIKKDQLKSFFSKLGNNLIKTLELDEAKVRSIDLEKAIFERDEHIRLVGLNYEAERNELLAERNELQSFVKSLITSNSWKITRPFRFVVKQLRKIYINLRFGLKAKLFSLKFRFSLLGIKRAPNQLHDLKKPGKPVESSKISCLKYSELGKEVALLVTHCPSGVLKPHLKRYAEALIHENIDVVLIIAADRALIDGQAWIFDLAKRIYIRENNGFDFAAWAHVLRLHREIYDAEILYLVNDSVIGPSNQKDFHSLISRVRESDSSIIGLTENFEQQWHLQSYFLALKNTVFQDYDFHAFIHEIVALENKNDVISHYEIPFSNRMRSRGFKLEALFNLGVKKNPTLFFWKELLDLNFPFIKIMLIRDDIEGVDRTGWREIFSAKGYDLDLSEELLMHFSESFYGSSKSIEEYFCTTVNVSDSRRKISFIGPWNYSNGLGVASRNYMTALLNSNFHVNYYPIKRPFHIHDRITPTVDVTDFVGPSDVVLIHLNPDAWAHLLDDSAKEVIERARYKIGLFVWESAKLPHDFIAAIEKIDAIWVPSSYCAEIFRAVTDLPVYVIPYPIAPTKETQSDSKEKLMRKELDLQENAKVILYIFDASSYLIRKNPIALVRAFIRSGLANQGWNLVLKTKLLSIENDDAYELVRLCDSAEGVTILNKSMGLDDLNTLMNIADIYASPHCAEGFGLTIAEAMAKGKVVVATDYSGSKDFLNSECGFPVECHEYKLDKDYGAYSKGSSWAIIDENNLAEKLIQASSLDAKKKHALSEKSKKRVEEILSAESVSSKIQLSIEKILNG